MGRHSKTSFAVGLLLLSAATWAAGALDVRRESRAIDDLVQAYHQAHDIQPVGLTTDDEFLRRAYLDIAGVIPPFDATARFLASTDPDKRPALIAALLRSPGFTSSFYNYWAGLLRLTPRVKDMPAGAYVEWVKQAIATNMPYDEFVTRLIAADGDSGDNGAVGYYLRDDRMRLDTVSATAQVFLGTQIGCAQCHDHKFDKWTQKDYYQFAAYMAQVDVNRQRPEIRKARREMEDASPQDQRRLQRYLRNLSADVVDRPRQELRYPDDYAYTNAAPGAVAVPKVIFGAPPEPRPGETRREGFARWLTAPDNPLFTNVIANRLWKRAIGIGLVEPADDFNDRTQPAYPELLDHLADLMQRAGYDMRLFLEVLYNTRTYQLASEGVEVTAADYAFQAAPLRRMTAEQIWDSLLTLAVADVDELPTTDYGELREQMMDPAGGGAPARRGERGREPRRASEIPPAARFADMLEQFGRPNGEVVSEGSAEPSIPQALFLMNSEQMARVVESRRSPLFETVRRYDTERDRVRAMYLAVLTREPGKRELDIALENLRTGPEGSDERYEDLAWALLNSREFLFIR